MLCLHRSSVKNTQDTNYVLVNFSTTICEKFASFTLEKIESRDLRSTFYRSNVFAIHVSSAQNVIKIFSKFFTRIRINRKRIL